jgi:hypothetical protein
MLVAADELIARMERSTAIAWLDRRPVPAYERVAAQPILAALATAGYDGMKTNLAESVGLVDHPLGRGSVTSNVHRAGQITRLAHLLDGPTGSELRRERLARCVLASVYGGLLASSLAIRAGF